MTAEALGKIGFLPADLTQLKGRFRMVFRPFPSGDALSVVKQVAVQPVKVVFDLSLNPSQRSSKNNFDIMLVIVPPDRHWGAGGIFARNDEYVRIHHRIQSPV